jgi:hypothetical protein
MKTKFSVYKGEINFLDNQIIITDGIFTWHKYVRMVTVTFYIVAGVYIISRYFNNQAIYTILMGVGVLLIGIIGLISGLKVNSDKKLDIRQVEKAVIKEDFASYLYLTLHLKNSQKRKVVLDYRDEDHFSKFYAKELIATFRSFSIETELK